MLQVRVIRKFHDDKGILIGYTIKDEVTGQEMNVYKDQLKNAVNSGQCRVVNMTLTSDGRFIGKAAPAPKKKVVPQVVAEDTRETLLEIYTTGKNIIGALVDQSKLANDTFGLSNLKGLTSGYGFDDGLMVTSQLKNNGYINVEIVNGKPDLSKIKRKTFKSVKPKLIKLVEDNFSYMKDIEITTEKHEGKYEYKLTILQYDEILNAGENNMPLVQILYCLILDSCINDKLKFKYIDEDMVYVECMTGINDVRKMVKKALKV